MELLHKMQDILDAKSPPIQKSTHEGSEHYSDDELLPDRSNVNFTQLALS